MPCLTAQSDSYVGPSWVASFQHCAVALSTGLALGAGLRGGEAQTVLSELAATTGLHVIASVDHVNAPLLWDKRTAARFNWLYQDLSTFAPYNLETVHMQPLLYSSR